MKKKPKRVPLNKYGMDFAKAFPTPLGKYIEMAEDQKCKLRQFEENIIRINHHKVEPTIS